MNFKNKVVLVTGSGRGIGKDIALSFAKLGAAIIVNAKTHKDELENTLNEIKIYSPSSTSFLCDVGSYEETEELFKHIKKTYNKLDILINNAGISHTGLFHEIKKDDFENLIHTNLYSVFYCSRLAAQIMIEQKEGVILNISSIWGDIGASCEAIYSMTKGGLNTFTKSIAKELAPCNIRVNALSPGIIDTEMNDNLSKKEMLAFVNSHVILGRVGKARDISGLATFLCSEYAAYITGQIVNVDGGYY